MQAEALHSALYDAELAMLGIYGLGDDEREVEVAVVVVHGAAAGLTAHEVAAVSFKSLHVHFAVRILVLPYHHCATVAPAKDTK